MAVRRSKKLRIDKLADELNKGVVAWTHREVDLWGVDWWLGSSEPVNPSDQLVAAFQPWHRRQDRAPGRRDDIGMG